MPLDAGFVFERARNETAEGRPLKFQDLTFPTAAENLAYDEALLEACEEDPSGEVLRFWEPKDYFVVVGYANSVEREVNVEACRKESIDIYRRCTGGGAVLQGPGCLNYSLVLRLDSGHPVDTITAANRYIMERHRQALADALELPICVRGITDLTVGERKFSGNAQRRKRNALIFHGTFLLALDIGKVERFLAMPSREPDYRDGRGHDQFLTNLQVTPAVIRNALRECWGAKEPLQKALDFGPLLKERYSTSQWNLKY